MNRFIVMLIASLYCGVSFAGSGVGKVTRIFVADGSSAVLFKLDSAIEDTPRCNENKRFSINLHKPGGMAAYRAILEAKREGYRVTVEGLNTCSNEWKSEDVEDIVIE